ncbi:single-stranded DNA-binding protein [Vagococcus entomophilus]|uniref:Single-stranded DNA-binding protein n=1 Tax=Vagococcus entomophilus TaxID=1160095 RepID=A0A430AKF8_9ENTE|nr:single-stranded DNA-binding protein [Vagococcus entomophilus]RSU08464.1 single-stranded DNA-binding protein [Vagococcus entomophilus]
MINNVILQGRLTKEIDLKYTQSGKAVASFTIAVNRNYTNANGANDADFIQIVFWNKQAETMANHFSKGDEVLIAGSIQTRNYENQQGQRVYITEIVGKEFSFTSGKKRQENTSQNINQNTSSNNHNYQDSLPGVDPFNKSGIDISDDDLPF